MWVCLLVSIAIFMACGVRPDSASSFLAWVLAQTTLFQYYNPTFLRDFGVGVINGSLWTIPVELEFYLVLPLLAMTAARRPWVWFGYAVAAAVMMLLARTYFGERVTMSEKLLAVSLIPYLFFFLVGVATRLIYERYPAVFRGKAALWAAVYTAWVGLSLFLGLRGSVGNQLSVAAILLLAALMVSLAFTRPDASARFLRHNDISYGVYIYHMPVINVLVFGGITGTRGFVAALLATVILAILSWRLVEKPALTLKNYSLQAAVSYRRPS